MKNITVCLCYLLKYSTVNIYTDFFHDDLRETLLSESKAGQAFIMKRLTAIFYFCLYGGYFLVLYVF